MQLSGLLAPHRDVLLCTLGERYANSGTYVAYKRGKKQSDAMTEGSSANSEFPDLSAFLILQIRSIIIDDDINHVQKGYS